MADKKISELDAITGAATAADDFFIVVDSSGAATKKISRAELNNAIEQDVLSVVDINGGTIDGTVIGGTTPAAITAAQYNSTEALPDIKPSLNLDFGNVKKLDPRITYTRASTGTYYDGVTFAKAEENLLLQSQDFTTSWTFARSTRPANTDTAPDGTLTADSFLQASGETVSGSVANNAFESIAGDYVFSVFAKPNGKNFLVMRETLLDGTINDTWFNVSTGTIGSTNPGHTAEIVASTNSYYRCSIKFTSASASTGTVAFLQADTDGSFTVTDSGGLYLWGAQLEQRSALTDYTATTTQPITNYVPALQTAASGEARFDHDPLTGESLGFLIEEQRTNLVLRSEDFSTSWSITGTASIGTNTVVAPDGTLTADKFVLGDTITSGGAAILQTVTKSAVATTYTVSLYIKAGEFNTLRLIFRDTASAANYVQAYFNAATGVIASGPTAAGTFTNASATITPVGNGWYRCTLTGTTSTETSVNTRIFNYQDGTGAATGNGYSGIYIWGTQLEAGAFPTSYIKTVASQATRNADAASMTGTNFSEWFNPSAGTLFTDGTSNPLQSADRSTGTFSNNTLANRMTITTGAANTVWNPFIITNNVAQAAGTVALSAPPTTSPKVAIAYAFNDFIASSSGLLSSNDTSVILPVVDRLYIGVSATGGAQWNSHIRKLAYYPKRLSNATLQALTEE